MKTKNIPLVLAGLTALGLAIYLIFFGVTIKNPSLDNINALPQNVTISGTYVCLPHRDTSGEMQTTECAFGIKTDDGVYYAVNFGQSATAMTQFQSGAHI